MFLNELDDKNRTMYFCIVNRSEKKDQPDYRRMTVYPAFPWKMVKGVDYKSEDPKVFFQACEDAGMVKHVRKIDDEEKKGLTITYEQWLKKHENEPGFVDRMSNLYEGWKEGGFV